MSDLTEQERLALEEEWRKKWGGEVQTPGLEDILKMIFGGMGTSPPGSPYATTLPESGRNLAEMLFGGMGTSPPGSPYTSSILPHRPSTLPLPPIPPSPPPLPTPPRPTTSPGLGNRPIVPQLPPTTPTTSPTPTPPATPATAAEEKTQYPPFEPPGVAPETDIKAEIQKIISGQPSTVKELMGREVEDKGKKLREGPFINQLLAGAFAGLAGTDLSKEIDRAQARADQKFQQDFEMAKSKLAVKTQLELKQLELMMMKDKENREGQAKMWSTLGESNPERFMNDPKWWGMGMKAYGLGDAEIRKWVQSNYDPKTGKYSGLYMSPAKREWESWKYLAGELAKLDPGQSMDVYLQRAKGNWPDLVKRKEEQLQLEYVTATPERKAEIQKILYNWKRIYDLVPPDQFIEIDRLAKLGVGKGGISAETANSLRDTLQLRSVLDKEIVGHIIDARSREKVAAMGVQKTQPNEAFFKQSNLARATSVGSINPVVVNMNPGYRTGLAGGNEKVVTQYNADVNHYTELMDAVKANAEPGAKKVELPKGSAQDLSRFYSAQKRHMVERGYGSVSQELGGFNADNLLLADYVIQLIEQGAPPESLIEFIKKAKKK